MHIVYRIIFNDRRQKNLLPFQYIGSKSNSEFKNGNIVDRAGNKYFGSSSWFGYQNIVEEELNLQIEILGEFEDYRDCLNFESTVQTEYDVVANTEYFNKSIATISTYTDPNYASYKHVSGLKCVRLPRNHPLVESGEYVGVSKGALFSEEERKKRARFGEENGFYGMKHSDETNKKIVDKRNETYENDPERRDAIFKEAGLRCSIKFKGVPKSEEQKEKIGRKGMIMLKHIHTGKSIRIMKTDSYDSNLWKNHNSAYFKNKKESDESN
jgi:hypothetical protein